MVLSIWSRDQMAANDGLSWWQRLLLWISSLRRQIERDRNVRRDANLNLYKCVYEWIDGKDSLALHFSAVKAESEDRARQLVTARAAELFSTVVVIEPGINSPRKELVSPFAQTNSRIVQPKWIVTAVPLEDWQLDLKKNGGFGPAGAGNCGISIQPIP
jgi:hypothetical protein